MTSLSCLSLSFDPLSFMNNMYLNTFRLGFRSIFFGCVVAYLTCILCLRCGTGASSYVFLHHSPILDTATLDTMSSRNTLDVSCVYSHINACRVLTFCSSCTQIVASQFSSSSADPSTAINSSHVPQTFRGIHLRAREALHTLAVQCLSVPSASTTE